MSIRKRNNGIWYCDIAHPNGQRVRRSLQTADEREAQELHDKIKHNLWKEDKLGKRPQHTWDEAAIRWLKEMSHKTTLADDAEKIMRLTKLRGLLLEHLTRDVIRDAVKPFGNTNSTKNRYLALIRAILNKAEKEWDWIEKAPAIKLYPEPKRRIRWLTHIEATRLIDALPAHYAEMARFALTTGLRQANILKLEWNQIDMQRHVAWIHPDQAKGRRAIGIPLNRTAIEVLSRQLGQHAIAVFTYRKQPICSISSSTWKKALEKAGIKDFRFHDLRHTWASWLVQAGTPLAALQEMGGWETPAMVQRYAHLSTEHLAKHASTLDNHLSINGTKTAHDTLEDIASQAVTAT